MDQHVSNELHSTQIDSQEQPATNISIAETASPPHRSHNMLLPPFRLQEEGHSDIQGHSEHGAQLTASTPTLYGRPLFPSVSSDYTSGDFIGYTLPSDIQSNSGSTIEKGNNSNAVSGFPSSCPQLHFTNTLLRATSYSSHPDPIGHSAGYPNSQQLSRPAKTFTHLYPSASMHNDQDRRLDQEDHQDSAFVEQEMSDDSGDHSTINTSAIIPPTVIAIPPTALKVAPDIQGPTASLAVGSGHGSIPSPQTRLRSFPMRPPSSGPRANVTPVVEIDIDQQHLLPYPWMLLLQSSNRLVLFHGLTFQLVSLHINQRTGALSFYPLANMDHILEPSLESQITSSPLLVDRNTSSIGLDSESISADNTVLSSTSSVTDQNQIIEMPSKHLTPHKTYVPDRPLPSWASTRGSTSKNPLLTLQGPSQPPKSPGTTAALATPPQILPIIPRNDTFSQDWIDILYIIDQYLSLHSQRPDAFRTRSPFPHQSTPNMYGVRPSGSVSPNIHLLKSQFDPEMTSDVSSHHIAKRKRLSLYETGPYVLGSDDDHGLDESGSYEFGTGGNPPPLSLPPPAAVPVLPFLESKSTKTGEGSAPPSGLLTCLERIDLSDHADASDPPPLDQSHEDRKIYGRVQNVSPASDAPLLTYDDGINVSVSRDGPLSPTADDSEVVDGDDNDDMNNNSHDGNDGNDDDDDDDSLRHTFYTHGACQYMPSMSGSVGSPDDLALASVPKVSLYPPHAYLPQYSNVHNEKERIYNSRISPLISFGGLTQPLQPPLDFQHHDEPAPHIYPLSIADTTSFSPSTRPSSSSIVSSAPKIMSSPLMDKAVVQSAPPSSGSLTYMSAQYFKILSLLNRLPQVMYQNTTTTRAKDNLQTKSHKRAVIAPADPSELSDRQHQSFDESSLNILQDDHASSIPRIDQHDGGRGIFQCPTCLHYRTYNDHSYGGRQRHDGANPKDDPLNPSHEYESGPGNLIYPIEERKTSRAKLPPSTHPSLFGPSTRVRGDDENNGDNNGHMGYPQSGQPNTMSRSQIQPDMSHNDSDNDDDDDPFSFLQNEIDIITSMTHEGEILLKTFSEKKKFIYTILEMYEKRKYQGHHSSSQQLHTGRDGNDEPTTHQYSSFIHPSKDDIPTTGMSRSRAGSRYNQSPPSFQNDHVHFTNPPSRYGAQVYAPPQVVQMDSDDELEIFDSSMDDRNKSLDDGDDEYDSKTEFSRDLRTKSSDIRPRASSTAISDKTGAPSSSSRYTSAPRQLTHPRFSIPSGADSENMSSMLNSLLLESQYNHNPTHEHESGANQANQLLHGFQLPPDIDPMAALTMFNMAYYNNPLSTVPQMLMPPQRENAATLRKESDHHHVDGEGDGDENTNEHGYQQPPHPRKKQAPTYTSLSPSALNEGYYSRFFREVRFLGSGGFGHVWLSEHVLDGVRLGYFAVKKIPVGAKEWLQRSLREVRAVERLRHQNVMAYFHSWLETTVLNEVPIICLFILMQYCELGGLERFVSPADDDLVALQLFKPQEDPSPQDRVIRYLQSQQIGSSLLKDCFTDASDGGTHQPMLYYNECQCLVPSVTHGDAAISHDPASPPLHAATASTLQRPHYRFSPPRVDIIDLLYVPRKPSTISVQLSVPFKPYFKHAFPHAYLLSPEVITTYGMYVNVFSHNIVAINKSSGSTLSALQSTLPQDLQCPVLSAPDVIPSPHLSSIIESVLLGKPSSRRGNSGNTSRITQSSAGFSLTTSSFDLRYALSPIAFSDPVKALHATTAYQHLLHARSSSLSPPLLSSSLHQSSSYLPGLLDTLHSYTTQQAVPLFLTEDVVWIIFIDICLGLLHLHQNGTAHRDVKLENVLLTDTTDTFRRFQTQNQHALKKCYASTALQHQKGSSKKNYEIQSGFIPDLYQFTPSSPLPDYDGLQEGLKAPPGVGRHRQHSRSHPGPTPCVYTSIETMFMTDPDAPQTVYAKIHPLYNNHEVLNIIRGKYSYQTSDGLLSSGTAGIPPRGSSPGDDPTLDDVGGDGLSLREKQLRLKHYQKQKLKQQQQQHKGISSSPNQSGSSDSTRSPQCISTVSDDDVPLAFAPENLCAFSHALISDFGAAKSIGVTDGLSHDAMPALGDPLTAMESTGSDLPPLTGSSGTDNPTLNAPNDQGHSGTLQYFAPEQLLRSSVGMYCRLEAQELLKESSHHQAMSSTDLLERLLQYLPRYPSVCPPAAIPPLLSATVLPPTNTMPIGQHHCLPSTIMKDFEMNLTSINDDFSNDIWALGVLLYILAFNHHPFSTDGVSQTSPSHLFDQLDAVHTPLCYPVYLTKAFNYIGLHSINEQSAGSTMASTEWAEPESVEKSQLVCPRSLSLQLMLAFILERDPQKRPTIQEILSHPLVRLHDFNNRLGFSMQILGRTAQMYQQLEISPYL